MESKQADAEFDTYKRAGDYSWLLLFCLFLVYGTKSLLNLKLQNIQSLITILLENWQTFVRPFTFPDVLKTKEIYPVAGLIKYYYCILFFSKDIGIALKVPKSSHFQIYYSHFLVCVLP